MAGLGKKLSSADRRNLVRQIVEQCKQIAQDYVSNWQPQNPSWETVDGCAYLRLSTEDQVTVEKGSLEQQIHIAVAEAQIRSSANSTNYRIARFFIEPGITGRHDNRPEFIRMKQEIERGKYKFVVFKEIARIAREVAIWKEFFKLCNSKRAEIFVRNFPINPNDPVQILQLDILAAFAEYESNQTSRRVRESTFSAMVSSGKFNSTWPILGLDQLTVNGDPKVGFYVPNETELKTVEWIMQRFILYGSYQKVLEDCAAYGIENKNGKPFNRRALQTLLTNRRYIGKWVVNARNRDENQKKLMPYDRCTEVSLPHGRVISLDLWSKVQEAVARVAGSKDKNTRIKRVFLLSGLLKSQTDGSQFHGAGATGARGRKDYYFNPKQKIRLSADAIEEEAKQTVAHIIRGSAPFRDAIKRKSVAGETMKQLLDSQSKRLQIELAELEEGKQSAAKRFDVLTKSATEDEVAIYRDEYKSELNRIRSDIENRRKTSESIELQRQQLADDEITSQALADRAQEIQDRIHAQDPVALKNAYRELFEAVWVNPSPKDGTVQLNFTLRGHQAEAITEEEMFRVGGKLVGAPGLEPGIRRL